LIVVEGAVQRDIQSQHRPFIFSVMQFAGGAGGASLGIAAGFLADSYGAKPVLSGAAIGEVMVGGAVFLPILISAQLQRQAMTKQGNSSHGL
jgi:hypothetical protein